MKLLGNISSPDDMDFLLFILKIVYGFYPMNTVFVFEKIDQVYTLIHKRGPEILHTALILYFLIYTALYDRKVASPDTLVFHVEQRNYQRTKWCKWNLLKLQVTRWNTNGFIVIEQSSEWSGFNEAGERGSMYVVLSSFIG